MEENDNTRITDNVKSQMQSRDDGLRELTLEELNKITGG